MAYIYKYLKYNIKFLLHYINSTGDIRIRISIYFDIYIYKNQMCVYVPYGLQRSRIDFNDIYM